MLHVHSRQQPKKCGSGDRRALGSLVSLSFSKTPPRQPPALREKLVPKIAKAFSAKGGKVAAGEVFVFTVFHSAYRGNTGDVLKHKPFVPTVESHGDVLAIETLRLAAEYLRSTA